jgi:CRP/FNR family transcriptional regulator
MHRVLKTAQLFAELDEDALREISAAATESKASTGELIFNEGDPAHSFYIVASGKVKVYKLSPDGKEQILMIAQPGDTFAEAAMFAGGEFPASAEAMEPTELVVISRAKFSAVLQHRPDLAMNLIARLAMLLRRMTRLIEALSLSDVNTRLARYLTTFRDLDTGRQLTEIHLIEKKTVLASQLGTIPETLSRAFAKLSKDGVIKVEGPNITVVEPKRLEELANPGQ